MNKKGAKRYFCWDINLTGLFVEGLGKLVDRRWDLKSLGENGALSLNANVLGPFDESAEITIWLDILADAKVAGSLLKERVCLLFWLNFLDSQRSRGHLLSHLLLRLFSTRGIKWK